MSIAKKCDLCGALYVPYSFMKKDEKQPNGFMFLNIDTVQHYWPHQVKDTCPECMTALQNFIKERGEINGRNL